MTYSSDIELRALEPDDIDLLYDVENDYNLWQHGAATVPYSRESLRQFLLNTTNDIYSDRQVRLVAQMRVGHQPVGLVDVFDFDPKHLRAELGLLILPPHQHKGYARQAMQQLLPLVRNWHLHQLTAVIAVSNTSALSLFRKLAFQEAAVLPDWLRKPDGTFTDAILFRQLL
ncbi:MAG: GNAT family N-acetyltransferase [Bacteroidaceae bacterium]|nr:GNAT family N-acetyltransferase [Bacteroidaceae bacterium]